MTKKERTIRACRQLAEKYRHPQGKVFFRMNHCPLCRIHRTHSSCRGCPLADIDADVGCADFRTFKAAINALIQADRGTRLDDVDFVEPYPEDLPTLFEFEKRAEFFEKIIPILEKISQERFTHSGWEYFGEIPRTW